MSDIKLLELRAEVALLDTRLAELVGRIGRNDSVQRWNELRAAYARLQTAIPTGDPMSFRAAMDALENSIAEGEQDYEIWSEIVAMVEQRRRLVESERRRLVETQQVITSAQAMTLLAMITDVVRRNVSDPRILAVISTEIRALIDHE